jgi:aspartyl-tRNA(Asn)/glutamyl-tRNA(Gln) amidotransferase subunit C
METVVRLNDKGERGSCAHQTNRTFRRKRYPNTTPFGTLHIVNENAPILLSRQEVAHVAKLARLKLNDQQLEQYRVQLSSVLTHIAKLKELDVTGVEPLAHPTELINRLDVDDVGGAMPVEQFLMNAPAVEDRFLAVPKVLDE